MSYYDPQYDAAFIVLGAIALGGASLLLAWLFCR